MSGSVYSFDDQMGIRKAELLYAVNTMAYQALELDSQINDARKQGMDEVPMRVVVVTPLKQADVFLDSTFRDVRIIVEELIRLDYPKVNKEQLKAMADREFGRLLHSLSRIHGFEYRQRSKAM